eukprot:Stramenopile-MAST_4_protein_5477
MRKSKAAGKKQKSAATRAGGSSLDVDMEALVKKAMVGGGVFFLIAAAIILVVKRNKLGLPSPQMLIETYVMTPVCMSTIAVAVVSYVLKKKWDQYQAGQRKKRAEELARLKQMETDLGHRDELAARKERSEKIDLKHATEATHVSAAGMRIGKGNEAGGVTIRRTVGDSEEESGEDDNALSEFQYWRSVGREADKERKSMASSHTVDAGDGNFDVSNSEAYLGQTRERTPIDLEDRPADVSARDVEVHVHMSIMWKMNLVRPDKLKVLIGCNRCDGRATVAVSGQWMDESSARTRCRKCSQIMGLRIRPTMVHQASRLLCRFVTDKCVVMDIMDGSTIVATCQECMCETCMPPIQRKARKERLCRSCDQKLAMSVTHFDIDGVPTAGEGRGALKTVGKLEKNKSKKGQQHHVLRPGQTLPRQGACDHFEKSFRWFRFSCCGAAYPCPACHALSECPEKERMANVMICGMC